MGGAILEFPPMALKFIVGVPAGPIQPPAHSNCYCALPFPQEPPRHHQPRRLRRIGRSRVQRPHVHEPEVAGGAGQLHHLDGNAVRLAEGAGAAGTVGMSGVHQPGEGGQGAQAGLDLL